MRSRYLMWIGHSLVLVLLVFGFWWLSSHMAGMPDYRLFIALVAMTGLVLNHFRWWVLSRQVEDTNTLIKLNHLIVSNYLILLLAFALVDIGN